MKDRFCAGLIILILIILSSCAGEEIVEEVESVEIEIISPRAQQHYKSKEDIQIVVAVSSASLDLQSYTCEITHSRWPPIFKEYKGELTGKKDTINSISYNFTTTTEKGFGFRVIIEDENGEMTEARTSFRVKG